MYDISIGLSVVISFILYETFGLLTGGMVSAGYLAMFFEQPFRIVATLVLAILIYLITRLISRRVILYGRRRFMLMILFGLVLGWLIEKLMIGLHVIPQDIRIIGHVVAGLIANDMYKQGILRVLLTVLLSAALVRLLLMLVTAL